MADARRHLTQRQRRGILFGQNGCCAECGHRINAARGDRYEIDHRIPLALGGADSVTNFQAICVACHAAKTKVDVKQIAKAKRVEAKHSGTYRKPRHIVPGSKDHRLQRKLNGAVIERATGRVIVQPWVRS